MGLAAKRELLKLFILHFLESLPAVFLPGLPALGVAS
jgi:hypothetical protein